MYGKALINGLLTISISLSPVRTAWAVGEHGGDAGMAAALLVTPGLVWYPPLGYSQRQGQGRLGGEGLFSRARRVVQTAAALPVSLGAGASKGARSGLPE